VPPAARKLATMLIVHADPSPTATKDFPLGSDFGAQSGLRLCSVRELHIDDGAILGGCGPVLVGIVHGFHCSR